LLKKIEKREIMTTRAAMVKYRAYYFMMMITEKIDSGDNDLGYVMYIADNERELLKIPTEEYKDKPIALLLGIAAEPYPLIGNVMYHA